MIRSTAPIVSAFAHVNALKGPDFGLRIHWVATAAKSMAMHMATIGWLRKKVFIAGNSRSRRRVRPFAHSWANSWASSWASSRARVANLPMHVDGIRAIHVVNASGRQVEPHLVRLADQCKNATARRIRGGIGNGDALRCGGELDRRRQIWSRTDAHHATMPARSLRQRHPCQRRLAVLCVIYRCFRSAGIEGRKGCIDVGWDKHFQSGFLAKASRFISAEAGQYDDGGYSSDHEPAGNSNPGAPRGARLLAPGGLLTWRPIVPAGRARGNLMFCFWFTHVSGTHPSLGVGDYDRRPM